MDRRSGTKIRFSRRQFLKGLPMGAVAALAVGAVAGRFVASALRRRSGPPAFPEGSIFTPAEDRNRST